jgi:hypothetical protein
VAGGGGVEDDVKALVQPVLDVNLLLELPRLRTSTVLKLCPLHTPGKGPSHEPDRIVPEAGEFDEKFFFTDHAFAN